MAFTAALVVAAAPVNSFGNIWLRSGIPWLIGTRKVSPGVHRARAKRGSKHGSGLGRWRWVVERTFAWLNQFRRLRVRYDKRADIHAAFRSLGCAWICWQALGKNWMTA